MNRQGSKTLWMKAKLDFYDLNHELSALILKPSVSHSVIRDKLATMSSVMNNLLELSCKTIEHYQKWGEVDRLAALQVDLDKIERIFTGTENKVTDFLTRTNVSFGRPRSPQAQSCQVSQTRSHTPQGRRSKSLAMMNQLEAEINELSQRLEQTIDEVRSEVETERVIASTPKYSEETRVKQRMGVPEIDVHEAAPATSTVTAVNTGARPRVCDRSGQGSTKNVMREIANIPVPSAPQYSAMNPEVNVNVNSQTRTGPAHEYYDISLDKRHPVQTSWPQNNYGAAPECSYGWPPSQVNSLPRSQTVHPTATQFANNGMNESVFDPARLLTRVQVPRFNGDKRNYESWKSAFTACVDKTAATPEYKLLRLRDCLKGEPLNVIDSLGHSAAAYEIGKERLERKYGGQRRQISLRLEELDKFKPVRDGNAKDLEQFAELLDVLAVNLMEAGQQQELGAGSLYVTIQRKINENLLSRYHRWIYEKGFTGGVQALRSYINMEAEFLTAASETVKGVTKNDQKTKKARRL